MNQSNLLEKILYLWQKFKTSHQTYCARNCVRHHHVDSPPHHRTPSVHRYREGIHPHRCTECMYRSEIPWLKIQNGRIHEHSTERDITS